MSVMGWRFFQVANKGALMSHNSEIWPPNEPLEAVCRMGWAGHHLTINGEPKPFVVEDVANWTTLSDKNVTVEGVPGEKCTCGIYSYKDPDLAWTYQSSPGQFLHTKFFKAFAVIECWGVVIEHELGWRAQFAQVRAVAMVNPNALHEVYSDVERYKIDAARGLMSPGIERMVLRWGGEDDGSDPEIQGTEWWPG